MDNTKIERPIVQIAINGTEVKKHPSSFFLATDAGYPWITSCLSYPVEVDVGKSGDRITVSLSCADKEHLLFTGEITSIDTREAYRDLHLSDSYVKLARQTVTPAYRKETAKAILGDMLDAAGITKTSLTCPAVELGRFSVNQLPISRVIPLLIKALEEHGYSGLRFFFDAENVFHFGTSKDSGVNPGRKYGFVTGKNIVKKINGGIEVLPLPIRHSQEVEVDGTRCMVTRTALTLTGSLSRLTLWLTEVVS